MFLQTVWREARGLVGTLRGHLEALGLPHDELGPALRGGGVDDDDDDDYDGEEGPARTKLVDWASFADEGWLVVAGGGGTGTPGGVGGAAKKGELTSRAAWLTGV